MKRGAEASGAALSCRCALAYGTADSTGYAKTSFVIPTNATVGIRTIYGYGAFPDRVDPDRITIR